MVTTSCAKLVPCRRQVCAHDTHTTRASKMAHKKAITQKQTNDDDTAAGTTFAQNQSHVVVVSSTPRAHQHPKNAPTDVTSVDARNSQNEYPQ